MSLQQILIKLLSSLIVTMTKVENHKIWKFNKIKPESL